MDDGRVWNVLFLGVGNAARSILAEGILNFAGKGRFRAFSAGTHPAGVVSPLAQAQLEAYCFDTQGLRSKPWQEFAAADAPPLDFIISLDDESATDINPAWPAAAVFAHWPIRSPEAQQGSDEAMCKAFAVSFSELGRRIYIFANLPLTRLSTTQLQRELEAIGALCEIGK